MHLSGSCAPRTLDRPDMADHAMRKTHPRHTHSPPALAPQVDFSGASLSTSVRPPHCVVGAPPAARHMECHWSQADLTATAKSLSRLSALQHGTHIVDTWCEFVCHTLREVVSRSLS